VPVGSQANGVTPGNSGHPTHLSSASSGIHAGQAVWAPNSPGTAHMPGLHGLAPDTPSVAQTPGSSDRSQLTRSTYPTGVVQSPHNMMGSGSGMMDVTAVMQV
jgi:hypothetical protein